MQIIKDKQIIENTWQFIADDQPLPATGDISVSLARWQLEKAALEQRSTQVGIRIQPTDNMENIADDLGKLALIELNFLLYTDGQAFSHARLLRSNYSYQGEIRAVGEFMVDQVYYLSRVGVNGFALSNPKLLPLALETMDDFSHAYQASSS